MKIQTLNVLHSKVTLFFNADWRKLPAVTFFHAHSVHDLFALFVIKMNVYFLLLAIYLNYHHYLLGKPDLKCIFCPGFNCIRPRITQRSIFSLLGEQSQNCGWVKSNLSMYIFWSQLLTATVPCMEAVFISEGLCDYLTMSTLGILCWNKCFLCRWLLIGLDRQSKFPTRWSII